MKSIVMITVVMGLAHNRTFHIALQAQAGEHLSLGWHALPAMMRILGLAESSVGGRVGVALEVEAAAQAVAVERNWLA